MAGKYDELSFGKAFNAARKEKGKGKKFTWKGKSYTTNYKEEEKPKVKRPKARDTSKKVDGTKAAPKTSLRPQARPTVGSTPAATAAETAEVKKRNAEIKLAERARKNTGPNAARKKPMAKKKVGPITFQMWQGMSRAERKSKGLPVSLIGGQLAFNRFKTGITGKEYDSKGNVINGSPGAASAGRNRGRK